MTTAVAVPSLVGAPGKPASRLTDRLADVWALTRRNLIHISREPMQLSDVTVQPVLFTLLFIYVFGSGIPIHGGTYKDFALAGLLTLNLTTSTMGTAVGLSTDLHEGVIDRFRTLPMWRAAILVGRSISDLLSATVCVIIVALTGLAIGWRPDASVPSIIAGFAIALFFSYSLSWASACFGLNSKGPGVGAIDGLHLLVPAGLHLQCTGAHHGHAGMVAGHRRLEPGQRGDRRRPPLVRESQSVGLEPGVAHAAPGRGRAVVVDRHPGGVRPVGRPHLQGAHGRVTAGAGA